MPRLRRFALFAFAALVLLSVAWLRGGEYDEYYSVFLVAGNARPAWPVKPFIAGTVRSAYDGHTTPGRIAHDLRQGDVHPPLYFWPLSVWRRIAGTTLFRLRLFSVVTTLVTLMLLASTARAIGLDPVLPVLFTLLCYGFAYSGIIARDFALANAFMLAGIRLLIGAERRDDTRFAVLGGMALGAASFTNYLAAFPAAAGLIWMILIAARRTKLWLAAGIGCAAFLPGGLWFFLAQRNSRAGQFAPFRLGHALGLLARDQAGAIFGGLPEYLPPPFSGVLAAMLALFLLVLAVLIIRSGLARLEPRYRLLCVLGFAAPAFGLLALGAMFNNMPIELRYFAFGLPFLGLLLAAALRDRPALVLLVLSVQAAAVIGLATAPATMQPGTRLAHEAAKQAGPDTLVLLPFGNDGVGIPGPFIAAAPDWLRIALVHEAGMDVLTEAAPFAGILIPPMVVDQQSRAVLPALLALFKVSPCWRTIPAAHGFAEFSNICEGRALLSGR